MEATYFFDPVCPFTWATSRWLVDVAPQRDVTIRWRAFSLSLLNGGEAPEEYRAPLAASGRALRLVESLRAAGDHDTIGRFYTELGTRAHDAGAAIDATIVLAAAEAAGVTDATPVLDDTKWDDAVQESLDAALALAGPGIGSPVLHVEGATRGLHGPIISITDKVSADDALTMWDSSVALMRIETFFEVKRGRG